MSELTHEQLRALLDYNPDTGVLTWKLRDLAWFKNCHDWKVWNTRYANKTAGYFACGGRLRAVRVLSIKYIASRLAHFWMVGSWPVHQIDHINTNPLDNRWNNLRPATRPQNIGNTKAHRDNRLGVKGVSCRGGRYCARIVISGISVNLGTYGTIKDAAAAYKQAADVVFGEFARAA